MEKVIERRGDLALIQIKAGDEKTARFTVKCGQGIQTNLSWDAAAKTYGICLMQILKAENEIIKRDLRESLNDGGYSVQKDEDLFLFVNKEKQLTGSIGRPGYKPDFNTCSVSDVGNGYLLSAVDPNGEVHWAKFDGKTWF